MTYLKATLIASAAMALMASPAIAGEKMHKDHMKTTATTQVNYDLAKSLSSEERMAWESKVKANMSAEKKAKWATYSAAEQEMWMDKKIAKMMTKQMTSPATLTPTRTATSKNAEAMKVNDTIGEIIQADGDADPEADRKLLMASGQQMAKSTLIAKESDNKVSNNAIVVPTVGTNVLTTVACPVGTTAQSDMTCLVTGNYEPMS